jgi:hypothetical protein
MQKLFFSFLRTFVEYNRTWNLHTRCIILPSIRICNHCITLYLEIQTYYWEPSNFSNFIQKVCLQGTTTTTTADCIIYTVITVCHGILDFRFFSVCKRRDSAIRRIASMYASNIQSIEEEEKHRYRVRGMRSGKCVTNACFRSFLERYMYYK